MRFGLLRGREREPQEPFVVGHDGWSRRTGRRGRSRPSRGRTARAAASCGSMPSGERLAWKSSIPISSPVCIGQPGSENSGGTWHRAQRGLAVEHGLAALAAAASYESFGRLRGGDRQLVEVQRRELGGDQVRRRPRLLPKPLGGHGELLRVLQTRVEERPLAVHLRVGHVGVPVRDRAPARVGVQVLTRPGRTRRGSAWRRSCRRGERPCRPGSAPRRTCPAPRLEHLAHRRSSTLQQVRDRLRFGRQRDDRAHVQIAVGPAVEPAADALEERVVHGGVAQRAGDPDARPGCSPCRRRP